MKTDEPNQLSLYMGRSMETHPLLGKSFFFWFFFDSICRRGLENTFDEKKLRTFLSKIARSRSFFRNVFGIARNTQKISGKSGDISKKIGPLYWNYRFLSHFLNKQQLEYTTVTELSFDTGNFAFYDQHWRVWNRVHFESVIELMNLSE